MRLTTSTHPTVSLMIPDLEISHLKTLDALYRFNSVSAAAESLAISQQAVSLQLKRIRQILNDRLFIASGQGVVPTPYAKQIEPHVQQVLAAMHNIPLPTTFSPATANQVLRISATDYTQQTVVSSLIAQLAESAPNVRVVMSNIESAELTRKMHLGSIDLALTSSDYVPDALHSERLFHEQYHCVSSAPSLAGRLPVSLREITNYPFIVTSPGVGSFKGSANDWFERSGFPRQVHTSAPSFQATQCILQQTEFVALLPTRLPLLEGLFVVPLESSPPGFDVVVAYHPSSKGNPFLEWVVSQIHANWKA